MLKSTVSAFFNSCSGWSSEDFTATAVLVVEAVAGRLVGAAVGAVLGVSSSSKAGVEEDVCVASKDIIIVPIKLNLAGWIKQHTARCEVHCSTIKYKLLGVVEFISCFNLLH